MARIRSVKPEFWSDFRMAKELSRDVRLFYIALWNEADDEGRFLAHPRRLLGACFPFDDDLKPQHIKQWMQCLVETGRLILYSAQGEPYGQLTKFSSHQQINRARPSRFPAPPLTVQRAINDESLTNQGTVTDESLRARKEQGAGSREQGSGSREGGADAPTRSRRVDISTWTPNEGHAQLAKSEGLNLAREDAKFRAYVPNRPKPYRDLDAGFTQWLLNARRFDSNGHHEPAEPVPKKPTPVEQWAADNPQEYAKIERAEHKLFERTEWWKDLSQQEQTSQLKTAIREKVLERIRSPEMASGP